MPGRIEPNQAPVGDHPGVKPFDLLDRSVAPVNGARPGQGRNVVNPCAKFRMRHASIQAHALLPGPWWLRWQRGRRLGNSKKRRDD